jgi:hypothetical protein
MGISLYEQRVQRLLDVLQRVGYQDGAAERWWSSGVSPDLVHRTAASAWRDGDRRLVERLVASLASRRLAAALAGSPEVVERLLSPAAE